MDEGSMGLPNIYQTPVMFQALFCSGCFCSSHTDNTVISSVLLQYPCRKETEAHRS